jgi:hypothetical protein
MPKLINPRTGEEQLIEIRAAEPVTREMGPVVVTVEDPEDSR